MNEAQKKTPGNLSDEHLYLFKILVVEPADSVSRQKAR